MDCGDSTKEIQQLLDPLKEAFKEATNEIFRKPERSPGIFEALVRAAKSTVDRLDIFTSPTPRLLIDYVSQLNPKNTKSMNTIKLMTTKAAKIQRKI